MPETRKPKPLLEFKPGTTAGKFTKTYVKKLERMMGHAFDPTYLAFLSAHNGGVPLRRDFKLGQNSKVVEHFLYLVPDYKDDAVFGQLDVGVVYSQVDDRLGNFLVPFAALFAGDLLCFDHEEEGRPRVVLWDHERSEEDAPEVTLIAQDFDAFLGMLVAD